MMKVLQYILTGGECSLKTASFSYLLCKLTLRKAQVVYKEI